MGLFIEQSCPERLAEELQTKARESKVKAGSVVSVTCSNCHKLTCNGRVITKNHDVIVDGYKGSCPTTNYEELTSSNPVKIAFDQEEEVRNFTEQYVGLRKGHLPE